MEINLSRFVVSNIYKYICLVYMLSSYTTVYFFDLYIQCALVYNYFKTVLTFCLNITRDMFWILIAMEYHIFGPARLTVYLRLCSIVAH